MAWVFDHLVQNDGRPALGAGGVGHGAVARRRLQQAGQQGGLADGELGGRLVEIALGGGLDAIGAGAEIDPVQIQRQDLLLGELGLQPHGQDQLLHLALDGLVRRQEEVARQLLGDGRGALHVAAGLQVHHHHAHHADGVEAEVVEEPAVLDGHHGGGHIGGQLVEIHRRGVLAAAHGQQDAGAVQVRDRGLMAGLIELGGVRQVAREQHEHARQGDQRPDARHRGPIDDLLRARASASAWFGRPVVGGGLLAPASIRREPAVPFVGHRLVSGAPVPRGLLTQSF